MAHESDVSRRDWVARLSVIGERSASLRSSKPTVRRHVRGRLAGAINANSGNGRAMLDASVASAVANFAKGSAARPRGLIALCRSSGTGDMTPPSFSRPASASAQRRTASRFVLYNVGSRAPNLESARVVA